MPSRPLCAQGNNSEGFISIPLPEGYSTYTIEYGLSCFRDDTGVAVKLNGVELDSINSTCAADRPANAPDCFEYPPPANCQTTYTGSYSPGDVLELCETGTSVAVIDSVKLGSPTVWFNSAAHCSTTKMQAFGWTVNCTAQTDGKCKASDTGRDGGHYHFSVSCTGLVEPRPRSPAPPVHRCHALASPCRCRTQA